MAGSPTVPSARHFYRNSRAFSPGWSLHILAACLLLCLVSAVKGVIPGTDPTGGRDSSPGLNAEVRRLCAATNNPHRVPVDAFLDLGGGLYRLDSPLQVDSSVNCTGVLRISRGTLLAGSGLGDDVLRAKNMSFLVTVLNYWSGLGVVLEDLVLACNHTSGGVRVDAAHHVHVLGSNILNFRTVGVWGSSLFGMGHDLVVERCRLTECTLGMAPCASYTSKNATGIIIEFPDSHFRSTVITCSRVGLVNRGGANNFHQLHIWTSCNHDAQGENLTVAFSEEGGESRISDLYIDNARLTIRAYRGSTITNCYFNGRARLELAPPSHSGVGSGQQEGGQGLAGGRMMAVGLVAAENNNSDDAAGLRRWSGMLNQPAVKAEGECEYWRGSMCRLIVTNNQFSCDDGSCGFIDTSLYVPPAAQQIYVKDNGFGLPNVTTCSLAASCNGTEACSKLFGPCV